MADNHKPALWEVQRFKNRAVCAEVPQTYGYGLVDAYFYPATNSEFAYKMARQFCTRCPAIGECRELIDSIEEDEPKSNIRGFWAGESPRERIKRRTAVVGS